MQRHRRSDSACPKFSIFEFFSDFFHIPIDNAAPAGAVSRLMSNAFDNNAIVSWSGNRPILPRVADFSLPVNALVVVLLLITVTGSGYF